MKYIDLMIHNDTITNRRAMEGYFLGNISNTKKM